MTFTEAKRLLDEALPETMYYSIKYEYNNHSRERENGIHIWFNVYIEALTHFREQHLETAVKKAIATYKQHIAETTLDEMNEELQNASTQTG